MADTPSLVIVQSFTYRGAYEEWSNRYHFNGTVPTDKAGWQVMSDALILKLKTCFDSTVHFERAYGYEAGTVPSVAQIDYSSPPNTVTPGSGSFTGVKMPGDVAATTRWETGELNTRGRKIYLRKYWHSVYEATGLVDKLDTGQKAAFDSLANALRLGTGFGAGGQTLAGPHGVSAGAALTDQYLTTRTLKRRGKRPLS